MVCDFCHEREPVIYLEQVAPNGQKRKINLCMECAIEHGISPDPKSIESSIGQLFKELSEKAKHIEEENARMCPVCGTTLLEIKQTAKAGCPECYAIFKDNIQHYLDVKGVRGTYTGTMPTRLASFRSVLNDRIALQNKLNDAIKNEDYEKAALYRDYLRALEKTPVSEGEQNS
ncbi:MAG TPA: DNA helicase UvrBC [Treponema sp.]|nr:DNA helicase UvrBC [Treponema sp.]